MTAVSLRPSQAEQGGLLDDVRVRLTEVRFVMWDYDGNITEPVPALRVSMQPLDKDGNPEGDIYTQHYSAGDKKFFIASDDGLRLENAEGSNKGGLSKSCNAHLFLNSVVDSGFPEERIEDDISIFDNLDCHVRRQPQPKRSGLINPGSEDKGPKTILLVDSITEGGLPWEQEAAPKGKAKPAAKPAATAKPAPGKPAAKPAPAAEGDEELVSEAEAAILEIASSAPYSDEGLPKAKISTEIFKKLKSNPNVKKIMVFAVKEDFLSAEERPWVYADGVVVAAS